MESEQRGRASRASSTSSLEVRCGCQYYQSDSLLPERRAVYAARPPSRTMQQPPAIRCSEHDYEPIAPPSPSPQPMSAPVVRITETDMVPVADSDDSIDDRGGRVPRLVLDGDVVLPLDGKIEDVAMEGRELGGTGDTSEEQDVLQPPSQTIQEFQERLEERFLSAATPCTESRTDGEINTSQVDSSTLEELPLRRGARGFHQRLRTQAGKIRSRLRGIHRPTFTFPGREKKVEKPHSASSGRSDKSRGEKRPSRMDRIRSSLAERPKFSLPERPKFALPERAKFHLPDKSKFHLPDRPKFSIKKPNIRLPSALTKKRRSSVRDGQTRSTDSTVGSSRRNIFDFSTYPRIFDKKSKSRGEYATSSPKDSRAQSAESATFPRARKRSSLTARWAQRFGDAAYLEDERVAAEKARAWHHPSLDESQQAARAQEEMITAPSMPWEEARKRLEEATKREPEPEEDEEEELRYMDYEQESAETSERQAQPTSQEESRTEEEFTSEHDQPELDPRLYGDRVVVQVPDERELMEEQLREQLEQLHEPEEEIQKPREHIQEPVEELQERVEEPPRPPKRMSKEQRVRRAQQRRWQAEEEEQLQGIAKEELDERQYDERYEASFQAVDPRSFAIRKMPSADEKMGEEAEEIEEQDVSAASDKEQQQSSGSSCDRRRRGIIEEIDSDEFFLRESGISQDDIGRYLTSDIRDALRSDINALADDSILPMEQPPQRPVRTRSLRKRKEDSEESLDVAPPARPKRDRGRRSQESIDDVFFDRASSSSKHRVVYQTEGIPAEFPTEEPLDDIVVVKPARRKSRSSSQSRVPQESFDATPPQPEITGTPPVVPSRRKRPRREIFSDRNGHATPVCNGHREWRDELRHSAPPGSPSMIADDLRETRQMDEVENLARRLRDDDYVEPVPMPPKRRSRSRTTSFAQDDDRTSHGAESLPEAGYIEDDIPRDETDSARDLSGYAIVEKREKPPRPPPPRRKRDKFSTTPRPTPPRRPQRAYSTLGPAKYRDAESILSESTSVTMEQDTTPYVEIDSDEGEHKDLRSGEVLSRMQGRPLPAPPRPPRSKKETILEQPTRPTEQLIEVSAGTQTDPLPDDMVIEEEVTQAKLVVAPSSFGSQIMVSAERIPSPARMITPPVPPLPTSQFARRDEEGRGSGATSPVMESILVGQTDEGIADQQAHLLRSTLLADDTLRIGSLEVADLKVDRLSVSQLDAHKIVASEVEAHKIIASEMEAQRIVASELEARKIIASEVDSLVITASEVRGIEPAPSVDKFSPSIIKELIAIRSHLESVAVSQVQQERRIEAEASEKDRAIIDIPTADDAKSSVAKSELAPESGIDRTIATSKDDQTAPPKTDTAEVKKREITATHTLTIAQDIDEESLRALESYPYHASGPKDESDVESKETHAVLPVTDTTSCEPLETETPPKRVPEPLESEMSPDSISDPVKSEATSQLVSDALTVDRSEKTGPTTPSEPSERTREQEDTDSAPDKRISRKSRSRSPSPVRGAVRQTASPVRSLPPVISVTPDTTPDVTVGRVSSSEPQRAVISYSQDVEPSQRESQRDFTPSPPPPPPPPPSVSFPMTGTHFVAFPASQVPPQFYSHIEPSSTHTEAEPSIASTTQQLLRVLRQAGVKAMRHFVGYLASRVGTDDSREKIRQIELAICALLLLVAGLLILFLGSSRTITHHHHWDYFNPPR